MNKLVLSLAWLGALGLSACDRPNQINVPVSPVVVPGPAGPPGATGNTGATGSPGATGSAGETGKPGEGTTVIVKPPASAAAY